MIRFAPVPFRHRLGQFSGITSTFAKQIVTEAEPALRSIIRIERNRFAQAIIEGIPFAALASVGYTGTYYLIPDGMKIAKAAGYIASAAALALGGWWTLSGLTEQPEAPKAPSGAPPEIARQTAEAIVKEAEPRIRLIVDEERARIAAAAQAGLPLAAASIAVFLATMFIVKDENKALKALGYSASALLLGGGAWITLESGKEAA